MNNLEIKCWRCLFLQKKHRLWRDGDWLFVTTSPFCKQHRNAAEAKAREHDLASEYDSFYRTLSSMERIETLSSAQAALDCAIKYQASIDKLSERTREKARTLLGLTTVVFSVIGGGITYVSSLMERAPGWVVAVEGILLIWVSTHLLRAIVVSSKAMTREVEVRPPLQQELASIEEAAKNPSVSRRRSAALTVYAANKHHSEVLKRINSMIVSQASFQWGIILIVPLLMAHFAALAAYRRGSLSHAGDAGIVLIDAGTDAMDAGTGVSNACLGASKRGSGILIADLGGADAGQGIGDAGAGTMGAGPGVSDAGPGVSDAGPGAGGARGTRVPVRRVGAEQRAQGHRSREVSHPRGTWACAGESLRCRSPWRSRPSRATGRAILTW